MHFFRAHAELALRLARTKADRKVAADVHLVILADSEFATASARELFTPLERDRPPAPALSCTVRHDSLTCMSYPMDARSRQP